MSWTTGIFIALAAGIVVWARVRSARWEKRQAAAARQHTIHLHAVKDLEVAGYRPIDQHELLLGGRNEKEWMN